ncbi:hypothetical protein NBRC110019_04660 [Neptunitalea chrysea]|uniref:Lysine transporter LysE n=2 Tax=Neptunitalea chrysea TaxID=1647581 RepID=A0A9W6EUK1_9FLAO|nr:hypothetical protein NBRC110019_04660 [Neptunitalea chrysea]
MNAAKISAEKGKKFAVYFSVGVCSIIALQAYLAVHISKFLFKNKHIIVYLMETALVIFAILAVYFFLHAKAKAGAEKKVKYISVSRRNSFFKGMLLGVLNLLTLPFYCGLNATWKVSGWIKFQWQDTLIFVISAALGTFSILYVYIFYFHKLELKSKSFTRYSDYIMGVLMVLLMLFTLIKLYYH